MTRAKSLLQGMLILTLLLGAAISPAQDDPKNFAFINYTGYEIAGLYFGAPGGVWSADFLGSDTLPNGYQRQIRFNPQASASCYLFIKVLYLNGAEQTSSRAWNLCAIRQINFYNGHLTAY